MNQHVSNFEPARDESRAVQKGRGAVMRKRAVGGAVRRMLLPMVRSLPRDLMRVTLLRFVIAAVRYVFLVFVMRRLRTTDSSSAAEGTVSHNLAGIYHVAVERSERLIAPMVSIDSVRTRIDRLKLLVVGPRSEGEILNLRALGFRKENISCLDLISYSPWVTLGDMHDMPYAEDSFDCIMLGWVISYSDDKQKAADEIMRVARSGAIVAIAVEWSRKDPEEAAKEFGYVVGSRERLNGADAILDLFRDRLDRVYFRHDDRDLPGEAGELMVVFRLS